MEVNLAAREKNSKRGFCVAKKAILPPVVNLDRSQMPLLQKCNFFAAA
jgi:hypothetical protein